MSKKITVTICGRRYNLIPEDDTLHLDEMAAELNREISAIMADARVTPMDAAILAALNIKEAMIRKDRGVEDLYRQMDEQREEQKKSEDALRRQIQEQVEENKRLRQDLADARREITRAKNGKRTGK